MNNYIDSYCERTMQEFWDEPLNALTNIAFLLAAFFAYRKAQHENALDKGMWGMIAILCAIGVGSFLFHTLATGWAMIADTTPILIFQIGFLGFYARRVMGFGWSGAAILLGLFFAHVLFFAQFPQSWLNGSLGYAPAFQFLLILAVYHWMAKKRERYGLLMAAGTFAVSLTLRTLDEKLCAFMPFGTHFVWHCLNAAVLYLCLRVLVVNKKEAVLP